MARLAVALSGGVDSSVAAVLAQRAGHELIALTMSRAGAPAGCASGTDDVAAAARVAEQLGLAHQVLELGAEFWAEVVEPFLDDYAAGLTPNPCFRCNPRLKFGRLLQAARDLGCAGLVSGHYARVEPLDDGWRLRRAVDPAKDQSYVLCGLSQEQLGGLRLPLGELRKDAVRALAREVGLASAERSDSQDLCFVAGSHAEFVTRLRPAAGQPGPIVDAAGRVLGSHRGLAWYTVGQRKGLGLGTAEPYFVTALRAECNELVVAAAAAAGVDEFALRPWGEPTPRGRLPVALAGLVQVRYRMSARPCEVWDVGEPLVRVRLAEPLRGVAPGQAAVIYDDQGHVLLGGPLETASPQP